MVTCYNRYRELLETLETASAESRTEYTPNIKEDPNNFDKLRNELRNYPLMFRHLIISVDNDPIGKEYLARDNSSFFEYRLNGSYSIVEPRKEISTPDITFNPKQANRVIADAIAMCEVGMTFMTNPNLVDYIGMSSSEYDYPSIMVVLTGAYDMTTIMLQQVLMQYNCVNGDKLCQLLQPVMMSKHGRFVMKSSNVTS